MAKALIVDDSRAIRLILAKTLGELGFDVTHAANGREALNVLRGGDGTSISVALVDWNMPEMTGIEFVREVRTAPEFDRLPLVMVTTETEIEQVALAMESGANEYVMKPFTREALQDKLRLLGIIQ